MARRQEKEKRIPTALRLPESLRERVASEADARGTSFNHMVIKALELYLDHLPAIDVPREALHKDKAS